MTRNNQQSAPRAKRKEKLTQNQNNTVNLYFAISTLQNKEPKRFFCSFWAIYLTFASYPPIYLQGAGYMKSSEWGILSSRRQDTKKNVEGAPNILGTPSWIVFRRDERQQKRQFILCQLMEGCEIFAISFLIIKKRKLESSSLVVAKVRSDTSKKRNIGYAGGFLARK